MYPLVRRGDIATPRLQSKRAASGSTANVLGSLEKSSVVYPRVAKLENLCAKALVNIIEASTISDSEPPSARRGSISMSSRVRTIISTLDKYPKLAALVFQNTAPASTTLYCAMSKMESIDTFDLTYLNNFGTAFNRVLDLKMIKPYGHYWRKLRRLNMRGASVDGEFLKILGSGKASETLEELDISSTFITDRDLENLKYFQSLKDLQINQCQLISLDGLKIIIKYCDKIEIFGANHLDIGPAAILLALLPSEEVPDPFPKLKELWMISDSFGNNSQSHISNFLANRQHLSRLRVWHVVSLLDYPPVNVEQILQILSKCPMRTMYLKFESMEVLSKAPHLRYLQAQVPAMTQAYIDNLSTCCVHLKTLIFTSTKFPMSPGINMSGLSHVEELAMADVQLGKILALPPKLKSITATIGVVDSNSCADAFVGAICMSKRLQKIHIFTSHAESRSASFTSSSIRVILESLPRLKDLGIDRDIFGRDDVSSESIVYIPIVHEHLQYLKIISSFERRMLPIVEYAPNLVYFESSNHAETMTSLESMSMYSTNLRCVRLRFNRTELHSWEQSQAAFKPVSKEDSQLKHTPRPNNNNNNIVGRVVSPRALFRKRSRSLSNIPGLQIPAVAISSTPRMDSPLPTLSTSLQNSRYLNTISIHGGTERLVSALPSFKTLSKLKLSNCITTNQFLVSLMEDAITLRDVELERCSGFRSISDLRMAKLAKISLCSCPDLAGALVFDGNHMQSLEIISVSNQAQVTELRLADLPSLRWATFQQISNPDIIDIKGVPNLNDLALETVTAFRVKIDAPHLQRVFLDCGRAYHSTDSAESDNVDTVDVEIIIKAPEVRRISWQADDWDLDESLTPFLDKPKLEVLDMPSASTEDIEPLAETFKRICPLLRAVGCGDGDVTLVVPTTSPH